MRKKLTLTAAWLAACVLVLCLVLVQDAFRDTGGVSTASLHQTALLTISSPSHAFTTLVRVIGIATTVIFMLVMYKKEHGQ